MKISEFSERDQTTPYEQTQSNMKLKPTNDAHTLVSTNKDNSNNQNNNLAHCNNNDISGMNTMNKYDLKSGTQKDTCTQDYSTVTNKMVINKTNDNKKEIYMVAEGYHKTDSCYYKTPDGGYHKLPPDSYHKMSEICYNKLPDGSFRRLVDLKNADNRSTGTGSADSSGGPPNKVRSHMIKFLKRSKSHSQATAKDTYLNYRKDIQRTKGRDKESLNQNETESSITLRNSTLPGQNNTGTKSNPYNCSNTNQRNTTHTGNRKVVVTMMENGGLPIVATSKSKPSKNEYKSHQSSVRDKVNLKNNNQKTNFILLLHIELF